MINVSPFDVALTSLVSLTIYLYFNSQDNLSKENQTSPQAFADLYLTCDQTMVEKNEGRERYNKERKRGL